MSPENIYSAPANADYSATPYLFGTLNSSGNIVITGTSAQALGVIKNSPASGAQARIEWGGVQKITAGSGGLAVGDKVYAENTGKGVTGIATAGAPYMGICTRAAAANAVAEMLWAPASNAG